MLLVRRDRVWSVAGKAEEDGVIGAVTDAGEGERAIEVDLHARDGRQHTGTLQAACEGERRAHGTDGVRGGGADADFEELEEACHNCRL